MTPTWNDYYEWLWLNILDNSHEDDYRHRKYGAEIEAPFREEAKKRYEITEENEEEETGETNLKQGLADLMDSIFEFKDDYDFSSYYGEQSGECYRLPSSFYDDYENNKNLKTWSQLFPDGWTGKNFGIKNEEREIKYGTWLKLEQIYEDWRQEANLSHVLEQTATQYDKTMEQLAKKALGGRIAVLAKKQGFDQQLRKWLTDYEKLNSEQKNNFESKKTEIEEMLAAIEQEEQEQIDNSSGWNWKKYGQYGLIGVFVILIIFLLLFIYKKVVG